MVPSTLRLCLRGHLSTKGRDGGCKICSSISKRKWDKKNATKYAEKKRLSNRKWLETNRAKKRLYDRKRSQTTKVKERHRIQEAGRRAKKRNVPCDIHKIDIKKQKMIQKCKCIYCVLKIIGENYHIDHFIPISRGGPHLLSNVVISCPECNLKKNNKHPLDFVKTIPKVRSPELDRRLLKLIKGAENDHWSESRSFIFTEDGVSTNV